MTIQTTNRAPSLPLMTSVRTAPCFPLIATGKKCSVRPVSCFRSEPGGSRRFRLEAAAAKRLARGAQSTARSESYVATCGIREAGVPGRVSREHMQECEAHSPTKSCERANISRFGRKARDDVGAERDVGPQAPHLIARIDRILAECRVSSLQNQVVAGL